MTLFLMRPMCNYEIWACQGDVSNRFEEEEPGQNGNEGKEEQGGHGLSRLASSKQESLKHSGNISFR